MRHVLAAALLGAASAAAFEPLAVPGLMVLTLAGFLAVVRTLRDAPVRWVLATGLAFGLAFMGPLIWWMNAVDPWAWVALVLIEALFIAGITWVLRAAVCAPFWPVWAAAVWAAGEQVRGAVPLSGFPWGRLSHTAIDTPLEGWVRLVALPATSWLMALVAGLLVVAVTDRRLVALAAAIAIPAIGLALPVGIADGGEERTVAVVQGNTPGPFLQWPRAEIFRLHVKETERIDRPVDVVIWPENGSDLDVTENAFARDEVVALSKRLGAPILVGAILNGPTDDTAYNASVLVDENGPREDVYLKQYPVPYGEYVPFREQLGSLVPRFDRDIPRDIVAGDEPGVMTLDGLSIGLTICWDIAYDGAVHGAVDLGAEVLAVQTSNASFMDFGRGVQPQQQWAISRLRAIETGRWVTVASTNGITGIVDPQGRVEGRADAKEPATVIARVQAAHGTTPATTWGDRWAVVIYVMSVAGWALGKWKLRAERRT
ncbi:apolipoprotein N-acyltransferase [Aeromicrobium flavum]|uniref:Apolipoprotein N-acyltransferase n=1 Tax=Aeromicrobium flavum TaxID=416568 RepID=A0A512HUM1_9ACTN|nr:apolipoprotein N-acyltransferase [Aeromicrobium flavum]GEO89144.1 apolipoprotein N-acyltransferase [Aeromicrobium flavum]